MASTISLLVLNTLPAFTGLLARSLHYDAGTLGAFASADIFGIALGTLLATPTLRFGSPRRTVMVGLGLLLTADVASALAPSGIILVTLRAIGGLGSGLTLGACFVVFALGERERNFAAYSLGQTGLAIAVMAAIPEIANLFGWRGPFLGLAALVVPVLVLAHNLPAQMTISEDSRPTGPSQRLVWFGIASVTLFFLGQGSLWTYLERIATASGIAEPMVNRALTACAAFGFVGAMVVLWLGSRVTRTSCVVASVLLNVVSAALVDSPNPWAFGTAISVFYFSLPIFAAGQFGAITRLPNGSAVSVYISTATFGGFALGPLLGAALVERWGYASVQWLDAVFVTGAGFLLLPLLQGRISRSQTTVPL
jgi:predicted MFS family arabinose efflux permease